MAVANAAEGSWEPGGVSQTINVFFHAPAVSYVSTLPTCNLAMLDSVFNQRCHIATCTFLYGI